jgi:hypothetical protein
MYIEGQGTIAGRQFPVGASLQPSVSNGTVVVNIHLTHVGPVPIPGVVVSPLMNVVNAKIASLVVNSPYQVVGVGTSDSGLEVYLKAR